MTMRLPVQSILSAGVVQLWVILVWSGASWLSAAAAEGMCKVYTNPPPAISGVEFKPVTLHRTEYGKLGAFNVTAALGEESSVKRTRRSGSRFSSSGKYEESEIYVRLQMRTIEEKQALCNVSVMVQYFVRSVARSSKDSSPKQHSKTIAQVDQLGSKVITVQFPPRSFHSSTYETLSVRRGQSVQESGEEFYGLLISVIDSSDAVLYQAASNSSLYDFARTSIAEFRKNRAESEIQTAEHELEVARKDYHSRKSDRVAKARFETAKRRVDKLRGKAPKGRYGVRL